MNAARSFIKLNWDVFIRAFGHELGFKSIKAQEYLQKSFDHHKTWHFLEIVYLSLSLELVTPYVKSISAGSRPSAGYWNWCKDIKNPNYVYVQHMAFTYLYSLMLFRVGVGKNDVKSFENAKTKILHLFFGRNHPIYQNIIYLDTLNTISMLEELNSLKKQFMSGSRTGNIDKSQRGDALLKEVNKDSKSWLKMAGIPSEKQWLRVFRNLDKLNELSTTLYFMSI